MELTWRIISGTLALSCGVILLGLAFWRCLKNSGDPPRLLFKVILTISGLATAGWLMTPGRDPSGQFINIIIAIAVSLPIGIMWVPAIGELIAKPFTSMFDGGDQEVDPQPLYSMAEMKRKNGLYLEAIGEIRKQLEKFPNDFTGTMMIAAIQAEDLHDLPGAAETLENLLATANVPAHSTAAALQALADWHLKFAEDQESARTYLQRIADSFPNTQLAHQAEQRLARFGTAGTTLVELEKKGPFVVKPGIQKIGLRRDVQPEDIEIDPSTLAAQYVNQLEQHPMDTDTREKLALLYAEKFQRLHLALDQLEQLIAHPSETVQHIGRWMNLVATLHIKHGNDIAAAEQTLHRLIERFPKSAVAYAATTRLAHLDQELKGLEKTATKTMGVYEGKLGLKNAGRTAVAE